jgi:predicted enzyme related to lactoylglutathione lyase
MSAADEQRATQGQVVYLQLPAADPAASAAFYEAVFGWSVDPERGRFEAPGIIGEWTTDRPPTRDTSVVWILAGQLWPVLDRITAHGGRVTGRPEPDGGRRYLVEGDDPAGNRIGVAVPIRRPTQAQTLVAVRDVEASSQWYQHLLGLRSDHGGSTMNGSSPAKPSSSSSTASSPTTITARSATPRASSATARLYFVVPQ